MFNIISLLFPQSGAGIEFSNYFHMLYWKIQVNLVYMTALEFILPTLLFHYSQVSWIDLSPMFWFLYYISPGNNCKSLKARILMIPTPFYFVVPVSFPKTGTSFCIIISQHTRSPWIIKTIPVMSHILSLFYSIEVGNFIMLSRYASVSKTGDTYDHINTLYMFQ
jgi:hypothetical protein